VRFFLSSFRGPRDSGLSLVLPPAPEPFSSSTFQEEMMMKTRRFSHAVLFLPPLLLALTLSFLSCGDDDPPTPPSGNSAGVNDYLAALPPWEEFASVADTANHQVGEMAADMSNAVLCTTTPYSITQNPDELVTFGSAPDVMYLGSLIQGESYLGGLGTMEELPIRQRAPLTIALKLLTGTDITRTINNPDAASVQAALNDMVAEAESAGHQSGSRISYTYRQSHTKVQAALSVGLSYKYLGSYGRGALRDATSEELTTITAFFKQVMFEAYIVRPQTPAEFFSDQFTKERLDEQVALGNIGPDNLPVYVARMQYGRMLAFSMTHTSSVSMLQAAVEAGYSGLTSVSTEIRAEVQNILQTATIDIATIGGSDNNTRALLRSGSLKQYFAEHDPLTTAEPLAYALYNLADGSLAVVSETAQYDVRQCSSAGVNCYLNKTQWEMAVAEMAGEGLITDFLTTPGNIALANEVGAPPGANMSLGSIITFEPANTGLPFTFYLRATIGGYRLVYDDQEGHPAFQPMDQQRSISIGDADDEENDNFEIGVPEWDRNHAVFAIGITVGDNAAEGEERIEVEGLGLSKTFAMSPDCPLTHGFIGVVSTVPLTSLFFNEGNGGDDIFVRDFRFGVLEWSD